MQSTSRGRPQDEAIRKRIITATLALVGRYGIDRLTFEMVAAEAHTSRPAIYRRWANKSDLIAEAIESDRPQLVAPDTGTLKGDLQQAAADFIAYYNTPHARQAVLAIMQLSAQDTNTASAWVERYGLPRIKNFASVFTRAIARGELSSDTDIPTLMYMLSASLLQFCLLSPLGEQVVPDATIPRVIDVLTAEKTTSRAA